jgi:hypothetical protein
MQILLEFPQVHLLNHHQEVMGWISKQTLILQVLVVLVNHVEMDKVARWKTANSLIQIKLHGWLNGKILEINHNLKTKDVYVQVFRIIKLVTKWDVKVFMAYLELKILKQIRYLLFIVTVKNR